MSLYRTTGFGFFSFWRLSGCIPWGLAVVVRGTILGGKRGHRRNRKGRERAAIECGPLPDEAVLEEPPVMAGDHTACGLQTKRKGVRIHEQ